MSKMVELKKITDDNMDECIELEVREDQPFVAGNMYSLADAYVSISNGAHATPYAIYAGDVMVGFIMYDYREISTDDTFGETCYHLWRFMVDKNHQGKGYGKQAAKKIIAEIKTMPYGKADYIYLSYEPENTVVKTLFASLGFEETDMKFDEECDEIIARLKIS